MKYKLFGSHTGLYASELILGTGRLGTRAGYGATKEDVKSIFEGYTDAGGNFIDTSDAYQLGEAEENIGRLIAGKRSDYIICSKYTRSNEANPAIANKGNHRKAMIQGVEASLKRLKTDYLDIYMPHYDDGKTPIEEIARGLEDLVRAGKIIYPGLTNFPAWKAAAMIGLSQGMQTIPLAAIQFDYSLLERTPDREFFPMVTQYGLAAMAYSPLAGGKLTAKYRNGETGRIQMMGLADVPENSSTKQIIDYLELLAAEKEATPGQIAIAWVMSKGAFPIIGPRTRAQLEDNLKATEINLELAEIEHLNQISAVALGYPHELLLKV